MIATALLWLALIFHIIITIGGNVLVCLAVGLSRRLWRISNCFVVSLAITDLLLGLLVMPFSASVELRRGQWSLGGVLCNLYISVDVMLCTSSILTLMAISVDRYLAISAPLSYSRRVTTARVTVATIAIWTCSLAVAFLPVHMGWNTADYKVQHLDWAIGDNQREGQYCLYEWKNTYVIAYTTGTFYLPLLLMTGMYLCIFRVARKQVHRIRAATPSFARSASTAAISKEHKATVTLAAVLGAFVICWFPYFTYFTFMGMKGWVIHPNTYHSIVLWGALDLHRGQEGRGKVTRDLRGDWVFSSDVLQLHSITLGSDAGVQSIIYLLPHFWSGEDKFACLKSTSWIGASICQIISAEVSWLQCTTPIISRILSAVLPFAETLRWLDPSSVADPLLLYLRMAGCTARCKQGIAKLMQSLQRLVFGTLTKDKTDDELEMTMVCHRPEGLEQLEAQTNFTKQELQILYRGFKNECPSGVVNEETFKHIYAQFFPHGDASMYAHYLFNAFDTTNNGSIKFKDFVMGLSILLRGTLQEKLEWTFHLYDINRDGYINREEMTEIVRAIYDMMGKYTYPALKGDVPQQHVDAFFQKMDKNKDGVVTLDEFIIACQEDETMMRSMQLFENVM
ncbi:hypothetical protein WMY93_011590 [Mugilogobius chulae]|uniref:G-protein coupled receptors family 1 profile domain-containing protein n=1 Tax=Mugilogobius chulae TaxID=88201 RepID=A0AAW0P6X3_9GOBI